MKPGIRIPRRRPSSDTTSRIYVCEDKARVGPFASRIEAQRFIRLIEIFGESTKGIKVIEISDAEAEGHNGHSHRRLVVNERFPG
jgi:hypothetical protein